MRLPVFLLFFLLPLCVPAQYDGPRKITEAEKKTLLANLPKIFQQVSTNFKALQAEQFEKEMLSIEVVKSKIYLFPADTRNYLRSDDVIRRYKHNFKVVYEYHELLPASTNDIFDIILPLLKSNKFEEVKPRGYYQDKDYITRAFRTKNLVLELVRYPNERLPGKILVSKKTEYYEPDVEVVDGVLPKGALPEVAIPFEERKTIAANLVKILADAPNQFRKIIKDKNNLNALKPDSYEAAIDLFTINTNNLRLPYIQYKGVNGNGASYKSISPYSFDKVAPVIADMLLGMSYDEVKNLDITTKDRTRIFRGPNGIVEINDPDYVHYKVHVSIYQNPAYYAPDVVLVTPGKYSPSSPSVPLNLNNLSSLYPYFNNKYEKGTHIDGRLIGGQYYNGNIYSYANSHEMKPSRFTGIYLTTKEYWNVEEVKGTAWWDYLNASFTGEFMPYDEFRSKLWGKGYLKQGSDSTFGYLYHSTSEPYVWFVPQDQGKSQITFAYSPSGKPYLENKREREAADAKSWAEAQARLKRLPQGYFSSDYKGPLYDGNGNPLSSGRRTSGSYSNNQANNKCSDCNGDGGTYKDCSYCGNTRTISGTTYDKVTVSGPFGGNNVTYEVAGSGRNQTTYCLKCMGFCISYPDVQKAFNKLWRKCTKCKGTGKPAK